MQRSDWLKLTGDRIQCNLSAFHVTRLASVDFVTQGAFLKLSVNSNLHFEQKQGQRIAVNCLLEGRDVFAVMPTGFGKSFIFASLLLYSYQMFVKCRHDTS